MTIPAFAFAVLLSLMPACPFEDSTLCAWDAQQQGNGAGRSFVALPFVTVYPAA